MAELMCRHLGRMGVQLATPPFAGSLGRRIFEEVSQEAWDLWLVHQTKWMNEHRLNPMHPAHREMIRSEMMRFLFGG